MKEDVRNHATLMGFKLTPEKNAHLPIVQSINKFNELNKDFNSMKTRFAFC